MVNEKKSQAKKQRSRLRGETSRGEANISTVSLGKVAKGSELFSLEDLKGLPFTKGEDRVINIIWNTYEALSSHGRDLETLLKGGQVPQRTRIKPKGEKSYNITRQLTDYPHLPISTIKGTLREAEKDLNAVLKGATELTKSLEGLKADLFAGLSPLMMGEGGQGLGIHKRLEEYHKALYQGCYLNRGEFLHDNLGESQVLELVNTFLARGNASNVKCSLNDFLHLITTYIGDTAPKEKDIPKEKGALEALFTDAKKITPKSSDAEKKEFVKKVTSKNKEIIHGIREILKDLRNEGIIRDLAYTYGKNVTFKNVWDATGDQGTYKRFAYLREALVVAQKNFTLGGDKIYSPETLRRNYLVTRVYNQLRRVAYDYHPRPLPKRDQETTDEERSILILDLPIPQGAHGSETLEYATQKGIAEAFKAVVAKWYEEALAEKKATAEEKKVAAEEKKATAEEKKAAGKKVTVKKTVKKATVDNIVGDKKTVTYPNNMPESFSVEYRLLNDPQNLADFVLEVLNSIEIAVPMPDGAYYKDYLDVNVLNFQEVLENILSIDGSSVYKQIERAIWQCLQEKDISRAQRLQNPSGDTTLSKEELLSQLSKEEVRKSGFVLRKLAPWMVARMRSTRGDMPTFDKVQEYPILIPIYSESKPGVIVKTLRRLEDLTKVESSKEVIEILEVLKEYLKSKDSRDKIQKVIINFEKKILPEVLDKSPWLIDDFGGTDLYYELFGLTKPIPEKLPVDVTDSGIRVGVKASNYKNEVEFTKNLTKEELSKILDGKAFLEPYRNVLLNFFTGTSKNDKITYLVSLEAMNPNSTPEKLEALLRALNTDEEGLEGLITARRNELANKLRTIEEINFDEDSILKRWLDLLQVSASAYKGRSIDRIQPFRDYIVKMGKRKGTKPAVYTSVAGDYDISVPKHIPTYALRATKIYNYIRYYADVKKFRGTVTDYRSKYGKYVEEVEKLVNYVRDNEGLPKELKTEIGITVPLLGVAIGEYPWINLPRTPKKKLRGSDVGFNIWIYETIVKKALGIFKDIFAPKDLRVRKGAISPVQTTDSSYETLFPLRLRGGAVVAELPLKSAPIVFFYNSIIVAFGGNRVYLGKDLMDVPSTSNGVTEVQIVNGAQKDIQKAVNESLGLRNRFELLLPNGKKVEIYGKELKPYLPYSRTTTAPNEFDKLLEEIEAKKSNPQGGSWFDLPLAEAWEEATDLDSFNLAQILAVMCTVLSFTTHMYADIVTPLLLEHKDSPIFTQNWLVKKLMPTKQLSELLNLIEIGSDQEVLMLCARRIFAQHSPVDVNMLITLARLTSCVPGIFDASTLENLGVSIFSMLPPKAKKMSITELLESQHGPKRLPECESVKPVKAGLWVDPGSKTVYQKIQGFWFAYPKSSSEPSKVYQEHAKRWRKINPNSPEETTTWYMKVPTKLLNFIDSLTDEEAPHKKYIKMYFKW